MSPDSSDALGSSGSPRSLAWIIAGSDSSGAAGLQADIRTFAAFGVHGACVVTAITAQGLGHFSSASAVSSELVLAQLDALSHMPRPSAVKIGMLACAATARIIARRLADLAAFVVLDPVLKTTSGGALAESGSVEALLEELLPRADLVTPNVPEAEALTGRRIETLDGMRQAAAALLAKGARRVLLKGGHLPVAASGLIHDYFTDGVRSFWLTSQARDLRVRGTGCTLASAVAANVARGLELDDALVVARAYVGRGIRLGCAVETMPGILPQGSWPVQAEDMPWLTYTAEAAHSRTPFPDCGTTPLGFYPVVDRAAWVARLIEQGVTTIQLRVKDLSGAALEREISAAISLSRERSVRLFINDHWPLAIRLGAYGVHLGQEDLQTADTAAIAKAGLRLGVSTHSYAEAAAAHALRPSYVALGPIFATTCKSMRFGPQGLARLAEWRSLLPYPLVAIGGMKLEHARDALALGAQSIAVISDVTQAADPDARTRAWLAVVPS